MKKALMIAFVVMLTITAQLVSNAHQVTKRSNVVRSAADAELLFQDLVENQTAPEFDYDKAIDTLIEKMKESGIIAPPRKTFRERFTEWASQLNVIRVLCWFYALVVLSIIAGDKLSKTTEIGQTIKKIKSQNDEMSHQIQTLAEVYDDLRADTESILNRIEQIQSQVGYPDVPELEEEPLDEDKFGPKHKKLG